MRRPEDGLYIGITNCRYYVSLDNISERVCCGGNKKYNVAFTKCTSKGIVEAEMICNASCTVREMDFAKMRR
jgi:hypothetical protein